MKIPFRSYIHVSVPWAAIVGQASQTGDADSSWSPGPTSGYQVSMNVHGGTLFLYRSYIHRLFCILLCKDGVCVHDTSTCINV